MNTLILNDLYDIADLNNIAVYHFPLHPLKSMSIPNTIAIDADQIHTSQDEKKCLAHELGHCMTCSFYHSTSKYEIRSRMEHRADRWAVHNLIPFSEFCKALQNGITERWQLAEYFDVTEDYIDKAARLYEERFYDVLEKK